MVSRSIRTICLTSSMSNFDIHPLLPTSAFRKIILSAIRELCFHDGSISFGDERVDPESQNAENNNKNSDEAGIMPARDLQSKSFEGLSRQDHRYSWHDPRSQQNKGNALLSQETSKRTSASGVAADAPLTIGSHNRSPSLQLHHLEGQSVRRGSITRLSSIRVRSTGSSMQIQDAESPVTSIPYLEKLRWACDEIGYPKEYADLLGAQFLGLDAADPVVQVNGHVPLVTELVEFVAQAYMRITNFADLIVVFIDDFQWVDSFTWKVIRALGQSGKNMLLICAMRSHDKQAMRRMSTAVNFRLEITLGPFCLPDIRELIASVLEYSESTIDDYLCTEIYQKTGGLPVYVVELLESIKRNSAILLNEDGILRLTKEGQIQEVRIFWILSPCIP